MARLLPAIASYFHHKPNVERFLWRLLSFLSCANDPTGWNALTTIAGLLVDGYLPHAEEPVHKQWRKHNHPDAQGVFMAKALLPNLLQAIGLATQTPWVENYGKVTACLLMHWGHWARTFLTCIIFVAFDDSILALKPALFGLFWLLASQHQRELPLCLHSVFSQGEWILLTAGTCLMLVEFLVPSGDLFLYQRVSIAGLVGCLLGIVISLRFSSLLLRVGVLVTVPLLCVEITLHDTVVEFPRSLFWLWGFLWQPEIAWNDDELPALRRWHWFLHWAVVLGVLLPLSPVSSHTVLTRKWFHLVAVVLFVPVSIGAPRLQSLAYAVAVAVLLTLECLRREIPVLNGFYQKYLDTSKDLSDKWVVSHTFLILGCALPHWMAAERDHLLSLWGVISVGVGDALGAIVGYRYGRLSWGHRRTIEGSLAMGTGMAVACVLSGSPISEWLPAVVFTTLLEAFTLQMDNLVLPLAGACVILVTRLSASIAEMVLMAEATVDDTDGDDVVSK